MIIFIQLNIHKSKKFFLNHYNIIKVKALNKATDNMRITNKFEIREY